MATMLAATILVPSVSPAAEPSRQATEQKKLNVLFIGNSFTACHNLSQVVKAMAEAGDPTLRFDVTTVLYGGRRLVDHWRLGTPNFVRIAELTAGEEQATVKSLEEMIAKDPKDKYAPSRAGPPPGSEQDPGEQTQEVGHCRASVVPRRHGGRQVAVRRVRAEVSPS